LEAQGRHKQALILLNRLLAAGNPENQDELEEHKKRLLSAIAKGTSKD